MTHNFTSTSPERLEHSVFPKWLPSLRYDQPARLSVVNNTRSSPVSFCAFSGMPLCAFCFLLLNVPPSISFLRFLRIFAANNLDRHSLILASSFLTRRNFFSFVLFDSSW